MGGFGIDVGFGLVAVIIWLATAPVIYRVVRGIATAPRAEQRVVIGEALMLIHIVLLVVTMVGLVYAGWDLM